MKKMMTWLSSVLKDEKGNPSSKRIMGVLCTITLCVTMYKNAFSEEHIAPSPALVNAVAALAFGALGLTSIDKFTKKNESNKGE